jgi:hypothetical protein
VLINHAGGGTGATKGPYLQLLAHTGGLLSHRHQVRLTLRQRVGGTAVRGGQLRKAMFRVGQLRVAP